MKEFVCIVCPNSCLLQVDEKTLAVSGNKCKRGETFGVNEMTNPMRTISSTVRTIFTENPVLPVRVSQDIPKDKIFDVMKEINKVLVKTKISRGDIVIENVLNLGVDIIATSNLLKEIY